MPIIAMQVVKDRDHENADSLRVYNLEAPGREPTSIIANRDNVYATGDVVAAALEGTILADGLLMERRKIRGVVSFGMLLGKVADAPGTVLTDRFGAKDAPPKEVDESSGLVEDAVWPRYTSIPTMLMVRDEILAVPDVVVTEKIHGSNLRFGWFGGRFVFGSHTSRVVDSRIAANTWPKGHLRSALEWSEREGVRERVERWHAANPTVKTLSVFGEVFGRVQDLQYGITDGADVRLFAEVNLDGRWLDYDDAVEFLANLFPEGPVTRVLVPVLYRGAPSIELLRKLRDEPSKFCAERKIQQISEGVVIRPATEAWSKITLDRLVVKYKSPLYEERKSLREVDPDKLPVYVSAFDLIYDCVTAERIRHVLDRAAASGMQISMKHHREFAALLLADIKKETRPDEWPPGSEAIREDTLVRWTRGIAGETLQKAVEGFGK